MEKFNLESCIMYTTNTNARLFRNVLSNRLKGSGLTYNMWLTLYYINKKKSISQNKLAKLVGITGPSMVKIVEKLEENGWIEKQPSKEDHRFKRINLTDAGDRKYQQALDKVIDFQDSMTSGISQSELDTMNSVFNKLTKNARRELDNNL